MVKIGKHHLPIFVTLTDLSPSQIDLTTAVLPTVTAIAWEVTDLLRAYYRGNDVTVVDKGGEPQTNADRAADLHILSRLQETYGDSCGYLTEETFSGRSEPCPQDWVWIVDPIDGTKEFINKTGEYAVHIALAYQQRPYLAVVALPETEKIYRAVRGQGCAVLDRTSPGARSIQVSPHKPLADSVVIASRSHRSPALEKILANLPCQQQLQVGSVGGKVAAILEGRADVYISQSGNSAPKDWDLAAPELILTEAGGAFTNSHGQELRYNQADVSQWGCLVASSGQWHQELCDICLAVAS
jgi:3'(2'), 5'-bisphosphate nucleotidase